MTPLTSSGSYAHKCRRTKGGYKISWSADFGYPGKPKQTRSFSRLTDEAGARRFCKKWNIKFPESEKQ